MYFNSSFNFVILKIANIIFPTDNFQNSSQQYNNKMFFASILDSKIEIEK